MPGLSRTLASAAGVWRITSQTPWRSLNCQTRWVMAVLAANFRLRIVSHFTDAKSGNSCQTLVDLGDPSGDTITVSIAPVI